MWHAVAMSIDLEPIGFVRGSRTDAIDDDWDSVSCTIEMDAERFTPESVQGLDAFSHVDVVYHFHLVDESEIVPGARRPRGRSDWPSIGIFAQRGKMRPNRLGVTTCRLIGVDFPSITVSGLDAIDGTPVLDIKPFMKGFAPRGEIAEPAWADELMATYW
jgi:tRNA (adenine37-N6)-methyltransferase